MTNAVIKVKLVRSLIGQMEKHRKVIDGMGLRKINQVKELQDIPEIRGMVAKVGHLVRIVE
ncbi:MAG: 50S ribosomal protein L30 [Magnetococcales bacterium]|nr:50S ribosomal protein L30 [Magnetococcales bacterium]NGZ27348.1 50S ribosomal protein L30 [Magnetococcales bacterium]